jgi:CheY-like chemotaxis protein
VFACLTREILYYVSLTSIINTYPLIRKFLLVDDDTDDAFIFNEAISKIGSVECITTGDALELFDLLSKHHIGNTDLIFLDINMPMINGWDCLKQLKSSSDYNNIPVIMYSTSSARRDIDTAYSLGADLFITKPEDFRELSGILEIVATHPMDSLLNQLKEFKSVKMM